MTERYEDRETCKRGHPLYGGALRPQPRTSGPGKPRRFGYRCGVCQDAWEKAHRVRDRKRAT